MQRIRNVIKVLLTNRSEPEYSTHEAVVVGCPPFPVEPDKPVIPMESQEGAEKERVGWKKSEGPEPKEPDQPKEPGEPEEPEEPDQPKEPVEPDQPKEPVEPEGPEEPEEHIESALLAHVFITTTNVDRPDTFATTISPYEVLCRHDNLHLNQDQRQQMELTTAEVLFTRK